MAAYVVSWILFVYFYINCGCWLSYLVCLSLKETLHFSTSPLFYIASRAFTFFFSVRNKLISFIPNVPILLISLTKFPIFLFFPKILSNVIFDAPKRTTMKWMRTDLFIDLSVLNSSQFFPLYRTANFFIWDFH